MRLYGRCVASFHVFRGVWKGSSSSSEKRHDPSILLVVVADTDNNNVDAIQYKCGGSICKCVSRQH